MLIGRRDFVKGTFLAFLNRAKMRKISERGFTTSVGLLILVLAEYVCVGSSLLAPPGCSVTFSQEELHDLPATSYLLWMRPLCEKYKLYLVWRAI